MGVHETTLLRSRFAKACMDVPCLFDAVCTLKLSVINSSYLKELYKESFYETDPPVTAMK